MKYNIEQLKKDFESGKNLKYLFFWGHRASADGKIGASCLSQWWPVNFEIDNVTYFSAEHYMMAEKARLFKDDKIWEKIIQSKSPAEAKKLGRQVAGFNEELWLKERFEIVKRGNFKGNILTKNIKILY